VFRRLKGAIIGLKDRGHVLFTVKQLLDWLPGEVGPFSLAELNTVIDLLAGPGAVMRLGFDDQVLLQPELLNTYGQAVIRTLAEDPEERGCLPEQRLLEGDLNFPPDIQELSRSEKSIILRGLQRELDNRALCIRDVDPSGNGSTLLVFPSYFRRQRPERPGEPEVFTTYRFNGPLEEVYSTLVVRLHHTTHFTSSAMWRDVADLTSQQSGQGLGVRLLKDPDGSGRIDLFADTDATRADHQMLTRFTHDHLHRYATQVERSRIYTCAACGTAAKDLDLVARKKRDGAAHIRCQECDNLIELWDDLEREFASDELRAVVLEQDRRAQAVIERETRTQTIIADIIATASRANQHARQVDRPGPGVEIIFVDDRGKPTDRRVVVHVDPGPLPQAEASVLTRLGPNSQIPSCTQCEPATKTPSSG
jgi:DNA-directed RNA polymerase subunit RPC12/RpoP